MTNSEVQIYMGKNVMGLVFGSVISYLEMLSKRYGIMSVLFLIIYKNFLLFLYVAGFLFSLTGSKHVSMQLSRTFSGLASLLFNRRYFDEIFSVSFSNVQETDPFPFHSSCNKHFI